MIKIEYGCLEISGIEVGNHLLIDASFSLYKYDTEVSIKRIDASLWLITDSLKSDLFKINLKSDDIVKEFGEYIQKAYDKKNDFIKWYDFEPDFTKKGEE